MTTPARPMFYQPVFGNDNGFMSHDSVDVAAFSAPALRHKDVALAEVIYTPMTAKAKA